MGINKDNNLLRPLIFWRLEALMASTQPPLEPLLKSISYIYTMKNNSKIYIHTGTVLLSPSTIRSYILHYLVTIFLYFIFIIFVSTFICYYIFFLLKFVNIYIDNKTTFTCDIFISNFIITCPFYTFFS